MAIQSILSPPTVPGHWSFTSLPPHLKLRRFTAPSDITIESFADLTRLHDDAQNHLAIDVRGHDLDGYDADA